MSQLNTTLSDGTVIHNASNVESPAHYTGAKYVEPVDLIASLPSCSGQAVKYLCRAGLKGGSVEKHLEDLAKASMWIEFERRRILGEPISDTLRKGLMNE